MRRVAARWFYRLVDAISETPIHEGAADFRLVSRRVVELFQGRVRERGLFLRALFSWVGFPSCPLRFRVGARCAGRSKFSFGQRCASASPAWWPSAECRCGRRSSSASFSACSVSSSSPSPSPARSRRGALLLRGSFAGLPVGLSGVQLVFLGVIGEYLGAVLDEVRARPHYVVEERINPEAREAPNRSSRLP